MRPLADSFDQFRSLETLPNEAKCPTCGYFDVSHPDLQRILKARDPRGTRKLLVQARCKCRLQRERAIAEAAQRQQQANLPHPNHPRTFANFEPREGTARMLVAAQRFVKYEGPRLLLLSGNPGVGKSHILEAIGRTCLDLSASVRYEVMGDLLDRLRHTYQDDSEGDMWELMTWYQGRQVLLLDDPGKERVTPFAREVFFRLVDDRIRNSKWLAVATNSNKEEFAERMGDALASRLFQERDDLAEVALVWVTAKDYRR